MLHTGDEAASSKDDVDKPIIGSIKMTNAKACFFVDLLLVRFSNYRLVIHFQFLVVGPDLEMVTKLP